MKRRPNKPRSEKIHKPQTGPHFRTLTEGWRLWERNMISDFTPPRIRAGLQGAFFAGAQTTMVLLQEINLDDSLSDPEKLAKLNELFNECQKFYQQQMTRRAEEQAEFGGGANAEGGAAPGVETGPGPTGDLREPTHGDTSAEPPREQALILDLPVNGVKDSGIKD